MVLYRGNNEKFHVFKIWVFFGGLGAAWASFKELGNKKAFKM